MRLTNPSLLVIPVSGPELAESVSLFLSRFMRNAWTSSSMLCPVATTVAFALRAAILMSLLLRTPQTVHVPYGAPACASVVWMWQTDAPYAFLKE